VVYIQNHDQIANTSAGRRLSTLAPLSAQKLAAAAVLCAPNLPLLFMGEEFGARTPFHYFVSHTDPGLVEAVRLGRRAEHEAFAEGESFADPQDERTFAACKLDWSCLEHAPHRHLLSLYSDLLALRRRCPALADGRKDLARVTMNEDEGWLALERGRDSDSGALCLFNFSDVRRRVTLSPAPGDYALALATWDARYGGQQAAEGSVLRVSAREPAVAVHVEPFAAAVYVKDRA
jgi:maltooligosyltrehalose trehalohydrolase